MPDGSCDDTIDGLCCDDEHGTLGVQAFCSSVTVACCDGLTCTSGINAACCPTPGLAGYTCGEDSDYDDVPDPCDNCPGCFNPANTQPTDCNGDGDTDDPTEGVGEQCDVDLDGFGLDCDNCPTIANPNQEDADSDEIGDACDNCPDMYNPSQVDSDATCSITGYSCGPPVGGTLYLTCQGGVPCQTDTIFANGYPGYGDACDNCDDDLNEDQVDCDGDGVGDVCDTEGDCDNDGTPDNCDPDTVDCDGDGTPDPCDNDDDNDTIPDDVDLCDFTPIGAPIDTNPDSCFYGTLSADLDGDCDVDEDDQAIFDDQFTDHGCEQGKDFTCGTCDSCCPSGQVSGN